MAKTPEQIQRDLLRPLFYTGTAYWVAVAISSGMVLSGVAAFSYQLYNGIGVWGLDSPYY